MEYNTIVFCDACFISTSLHFVSFILDSMPPPCSRFTPNSLPPSHPPLCLPDLNVIFPPSLFNCSLPTGPLLLTYIVLIFTPFSNIFHLYLSFSPELFWILVISFPLLPYLPFPSLLTTFPFQCLRVTSDFILSDPMTSLDYG